MEAELLLADTRAVLIRMIRIFSMPPRRFFQQAESISFYLGIKKNSTLN
jgi:hypothetical protein